MAIPGLPGGLIIYQGHLFPLKEHLCKEHRPRDASRDSDFFRRTRCCGSCCPGLGPRLVGPGSEGSSRDYRSPSSALLPFLGDCSPTKIDYRKKGTLVLTSLLEDLGEMFMRDVRVWPSTSENKFRPPLQKNVRVPLKGTMTMTRTVTHIFALFLWRRQRCMSWVGRL